MTHIEELQENIRRLKVTISKTDTHTEGYLNNCRRQLAAYETRLEELQHEQRPRYHAIVGHCENRDDDTHILPEPVTRDEALAKGRLALDPDNEHAEDEIYITALLASDSPITYVNTWSS